jgi:hypothetical protein
LRAALLASASLIALAALGAPGVAHAACIGVSQTISTPTPATVLSNGGDITVTGGGIINGQLTGVAAPSCPINTLSNNGKILGGPGVTFFDRTGGKSVDNGSTITTLNNNGQISGGVGFFDPGGAGVANEMGATIGTLNNRAGATIQGGAGSNLGNALTPSTAAPGGAGISNSGTITALSNSGKIRGGDGGSNAPALFGIAGGAGGVGVLNDGTITTLTVSVQGTIEGGAGGSGAPNGGAGGAGLVNSNTITNLINNGTISGGLGGAGYKGATRGAGGNGGDGILNTGTITMLTNTGSIFVGRGGPGGRAGAAGMNDLGTVDALNNSGTIGGTGGIAIVGLIGSITNSGQIMGDVVIGEPVVVTGGSGNTFGNWTGGTIRITGDLVFGGGNTHLGDDIVVGDHQGKVTNKGALRLDASETIFGNFDQSPTGTLDFLLTSATNQHQLTVTADANLNGVLGASFGKGVLADGASFDLLRANDLSGDFSGFSFYGKPCAAGPGDLWNCGDNVIFAVNVTEGLNGFVDLTVVNVLEPATWGLLAVGFGGLGGLASLRRRRQPVSGSAATSNILSSRTA